MSDNKQLQKEVEEALEQQGDFQFDTSIDEEQSPLNQPVKEKDIAQTKEGIGITDPLDEQQNESDSGEPFAEFGENQFDDAPEQVIGSNFDPNNPPKAPEPQPEIPTEHAKMMANAFLGMTNNFLGLGLGFFVRIKKKKDFYEFEEVIQVIDEFNERNVKKVILDEQDKALLIPLLVQVLKKKAQNVTPEQQLIGAIISILIKKVQMMLEIRSENEKLLDKISDMISVRNDSIAAETEEFEEFPEGESIEDQQVQEVETAEESSTVPTDQTEV